ncbi:DNA replication/repair protein RecF [Bosea sp. (in: a-proteobacteria)]|uniref:DNA replication/repair protein RecF n=1 Tax=Bosea sp. (in: a-proteobacteria) TaxID=1871050 RepID=UPI0012123612|nr:DNA replication/repair protein RecF [Bosea sp. (in: a-proteobacteria)]TAJ26976.1 MAG: DNA replication/repair protein RecF [Bosea sp. (in: a-proteobacteria)]
MTAVSRLILQDFRSYEALDLPVEGQIVALIGENGAGKTNILEALSLFAPGRGLRRAELPAMARLGGDGSFAASVTLAEEAGRLGVGLAPPDPEGRRARLTRIDGQPAGSALAFSEYLRLVWLTPDLDGLFRGAAGDRRRFLDRLVLAIDPGHATRSNALERALRSRNRILEESPGQSQWLDAIEREIAELGVAVAAARAETVARLSAIIAESRDEASPFPFADLALAGEVDALVARLPALDAEDAYRDLLRQGRLRDRAAGRTLAGPQASDLEVRHGPKDIPAGQGSTGEQKALLIGLVLAHARLVAAMSGIKPLVLLDEIAAHLDPRRRAALYEGLTGLGCQIWMTGADAALFGDLPAGSQRVRVETGKVVVE